MRGELPKGIKMKDTRYDEKGKYFTAQVTKRSVWTTLATAANVFRGRMHLLPENRLKDELNNGERFIALTETQVYAPDGVTQLYSVPLVIVNKEQIVWVFPESDGDGDKPISEE